MTEDNRTPGFTELGLIVIVTELEFRPGLLAIVAGSMYCQNPAAHGAN